MSKAQGKKTASMGGKQRTLEFDINNLCDMEAELGVPGRPKPVFEVFGELSGTPSFTLLRTLIRYAVRKNYDADKEGEPLTDELIGEWIQKAGFKKSLQLTVEAFVLAFPDIAEQAEESGNVPKK